MKTLVGVCLLAGLLVAAHAAEFSFETDTVRLVIGADAVNKRLVEKKTGRDWLLTSGPFAGVRKGGKWFLATALARSGGLWRVRFGDSGIEADYRITARPRCVVFGLAKLRGDGVEEFRLAQVRVKIGARPGDHVGSWLAVRWNNEFAVTLLGLSDCVETKPLGDDSINAFVYPEFGMEGQRVALIAEPTPRLYRAIEQVEREFGLPCPKLGGQWAKTSRDVRTSYLFIDLTEKNAGETIRYAKLGGFGYIMTYSSTWSSSLGSYPINTNNFPRGEASLKATIEQCHRAGLKVGVHTLTSFIGKNDPLVRPKPDPRLLTDDETVLAVDIDEKATNIVAASSVIGFPTERAFYGSHKAGLDIRIDDEIIQYGELGDSGTNTFLRCVRGFAGTQAVRHKAGAKVRHLAERYGCYLADLRTPLKGVISERIAGVINRCGFDMISFDGGECNDANGPFWYWVSQQQDDICRRVTRPLLAHVWGSTPWTWHWCARIECDDFAAVAPKQHLDCHKIADSWRGARDNFMPAELGWWGFLADEPHHPATSLDEVEFYAVRMFALDAPVSLETSLGALKRNARAEEMLRLLGDYERLRLSGAVPASIRGKLREGEWHMVRSVAAGTRKQTAFATNKPTFQPIRYDAQRIGVPGGARVNNGFAAQPLKFRLQCVPTLAPVGAATNIVLLRADAPLELPPPAPKTPMPGALCQRVEFTKPAGDQISVLMVGANTQAGGGTAGKPLDLVRHRALAVRLVIEGTPSNSANAPAVLNVQLESSGKTYRDHYVNLDFNGERTIVFPEPTTERMLPEFRPTDANYNFRMAMYGFNYKQIIALNLRWMRMTKQPVHCRIALVEALAEQDAPLKNPMLALGGTTLTIPAELKTGDYAEFWADGPTRVFDRNGVTIATVKPAGALSTLQPGENKLALAGDSAGAAKLTVITLGEPLTTQR